jgi:hypothetical protein
LTSTLIELLSFSPRVTRQTPIIAQLEKGTQHGDQSGVERGENQARGFDRVAGIIAVLDPRDSIAS